MPVFYLPPSQLEEAVLTQPEVTDTFAPLLAAAPDTVDVAEVAAPTPIPEPSTWTMVAAGAGLLLLPRRRRIDNTVR